MARQRQLPAVLDRWFGLCLRAWALAVDGRPRAGLAPTVAAAPGAYTNWDSIEPNNNNQPPTRAEQGCAAMTLLKSVWDDQYAPTGYRTLRVGAHRAKSSAVSLAAGEARYFELLHAHNSSAKLWLFRAGIRNRRRVHARRRHALAVDGVLPGEDHRSVTGRRERRLHRNAWPAPGSYTYAKEATPTITDVFPRGRGRPAHLDRRDPLLRRRRESRSASAARRRRVPRQPHGDRALRRGEATAGRYPVDVRVVGVGRARQQGEREIPLEIHDFALRNGSVLGGDIIRIWGEGFSRLGPRIT